MKNSTLLSILFLSLLAPCALSAQVRFAWDYDAAEQDKIDGFHLWGTKTPGNYPDPFVGTFPPASRSGTAPDPDRYGRFCWTLTAFADVAESDRSNEVCKILKPPKPGSFREEILAGILYPAKKLRDLLAGLFGKKDDSPRIRILDN